MMKFLILIATLFCLLPGCSESDSPTTSSTPGSCPAGTSCEKQPVPSALVGLEIIPPIQNTQGWVSSELPLGELDENLQFLFPRVEQGIALEGAVHASDNIDKSIPSQIIAWRTSLLPGRPPVQSIASYGNSLTLKDNTQPPFSLWLNRGQNYQILITPLDPYDEKYPPLLIANLTLHESLKKDFLLQAPDRSFKISGRVLDSAGNPLPQYRYFDPVKQTYLPSSMRLQAISEDSLESSSVGHTDPAYGTYNIYVPFGVHPYTLRFENLAGHMPLPDIECPGVLIGASIDEKTGQALALGDFRLPEITWPENYKFRLQTAEEKPVPWATIVFATSFQTNKTIAGAAKSCVGKYIRQATTNAAGEVIIPLIRDALGKTLGYQVAIYSPSGQQAASQLLAWNATPANPDEAIIFEISRRFRVTGKVVNAQAVPINSAKVISRGPLIASDRLAYSVPSVTSTTTNDNGVFEIYVDPEAQYFDVVPSPDTSIPSFTVATEKITNDLEGQTFKAPEGLIYHGRIYAPSGQDGLPNAQIQAFDTWHENNVDTPLTRLRANGISNHNGEFSLTLPLPSVSP